MNKNIVKLRQYINSDNNPIYADEKEYNLCRLNGSRLITYNEPELLTRYKVITSLDLIVRNKIIPHLISKR
jgi:hypothetical protein